MRAIFWRFYLTVAAFFLVSALIVGSIYKHILNQSGQHYLSDIFKTTLYLIEDELIDVPQDMWRKEMIRLRDKIPIHVEIAPLDTYLLNLDNQRALFKGQIIVLKEKGLFLQRIPGSQYMLVLGPVNYLNDLSSLQWVDYLMFLTLCLSLAIPAFLWLRPLWRQLQQLSVVSQSLGTANFTARVTLPNASPLKTLANTFNSMANNIQQLMNDRKLMIDAVSHDLRTPIARLRYRLEALRAQIPLDKQAQLFQPIIKDLDYLGEMTNELLLFSRFDQTDVALERHDVSLLEWLTHILDEFDWQTLPTVSNKTGEVSPIGRINTYYLARAVTNLLTNARRYGNKKVAIVLEKDAQYMMIHVDDDGPGIPLAERQNVLKPFIRLDAARSLQAGGYGMGLAIVQKILTWHQGKVIITESAWRGAWVTLAWPH